MKKLQHIFLTLILLATLGVGQMWGGTSTTVYCAVDASKMESSDGNKTCYKLVCNTNHKGDGDDWHAYDMSKTDYTKNGKLIYSVSFTDTYNGLGCIQFQIKKTDDTWIEQVQPFGTKSWTSASTYNNKLWVYGSSGWNTYSKDDAYTVYFVNTSSWTAANVKAYAYNNDCDYNAGWAGTKMTSTGKTYNGKDIYSITLDKRYSKIIFSNNGSSQTADLDCYSNAGKMYYDDSWIAYKYDITITSSATNGTVSPSSQTIINNGSDSKTFTATANSGYAFSSWSGSGLSFSPSSTSNPVTVTSTSSSNVTLTANFVAEETHNVTVYYKYGSTTVKTATTESAVGVTTARSFTAPEIDGYNFYSYTFGSGLTMKSANTTTNPCSFVTKGSGDYELTVNYNIAPVKLLYGNSTPLNSPSNTAMTYDATAKAYYVDVTTNSSPYYFRFDFNNTTQEYAGDWNTYPNVNEVTANGAKVACATEVKGWENKSSLKFTGANGSSIRIWFSYKDKQAWIVETTYTVTVASGGNGTVSPASVTAGKNTSASITATPSTNFVFDGWTASTANITIANSASASTTVKATSAGTVTANFANKWAIKGYGGVMGDWDTWLGLPNTASNTFSGTFTLSAGTYYFKVVNRSSNTWYTEPSKVITRAANTASATTTTGENNNITLTADLPGSYTFTFNSSTKALTVTYPTRYTITYAIGAANGTSGSISASPSVASGDYVVSGTVVTLTAPTEKSGYEWYGWYGNEDGTGVQLCSTKEYAVTVNADKTVYACYKKLGVTLECSPTIVAQNGTVTATPSIYPAPTPGSYVICWRLLHSNGNLVESQPTFTPTGVGDAVSFTAPSTSGMYLIAAIQHSGSECNAGVVLDSVTTSLQVAGDHTVTVEYKCGSETIKESTTTIGRPLAWSSVINPPEIFGYTFSRWVAVDGVTLSTDGTSELGSDNTTTPAIYIKAIYDGKLKAEYTQNQYIYFKNTLNWSNVYVNFYTDSYWNNPKGSGNSGVTNKNLAMTRIGETDVWYYDYGGASITPTLYVSFTSESQNGSENFWHKSPDVNVVYPANYPDDIHTDKSAENGFKAATPMFVPLASQAAIPLNSSGGGKANYYNAGYWTMYTPGTGYTLEIYYDHDESPTVKSIEFTSDDELMPMKAIASLEANTTYRYQLRRGGTGDDGIYYGNTGTMTYSNHEAWDMNNSMYPFKKAKITTNAAGDYTFNLNYAGHKDATTSYRLRMSVDYPIATGDYRLIYKDNAQTNWKASGIVTNVANGKDTVSFFVRKAQTPKLRIQKATVNPSTGAITWAEYPTPGTQTNQITGTISTAITKDSVWNFCLVMDGSGNLSVAKAEAYTGNYYIRTDPANSKWDNYRSDPDHLMTYSEYSITHGGYSHYFCHWVQTDDRKNIKFCIANDYSPSISDTLIRETASGTWEHIADFIDADGNILRNANVRFMWDQHTNTISRAYIDGAYISGGDDFLVLVSGDSKILNPSTSAVQATTTFYDNQNWIYEANVKAIPNAQIKLRSIWGKDGETTHKITQYFKGGTSSTETLITGSGSDPYDIRLLYDFKTNRLVAAMLPSGNYDDPEAIHADVMFIRDHQGDVSQLTFTDDGKITDINTAYAVIQLNKWTLNNKERTGSHAPLGAPASIYERSMYFISFPFQVNLSEVFGFGTYGEHWAIEYYDGEERAAKGYWMGDPGFWKFYWDRRNVVLEPNKGYILAIDLDLLGEESDVWANGNERAELFFPSAGSLGSITNSTVTKSLHEHACTINRAATEGLPDTPDNPHTSYNRTIFDSHWNVMGVPTYVNTAAQSWANTSWITATVDHKTQGPNFLYTWNMDDNTLTPTSGASFKYHAMHSYMVQYYGNVTWKTAQGPAAIVARRAYAAAPKNVEFCIEISDSEKMLDRTFLRLSEEEEVSANFAFNEDMTKDMNGRKANIYTLTADNVAAAGNTMPLNDQTLIVPLNVVTWTADNFTISIPEGTSGIGVTLVDEETGERTNLALGDYSRYLEKGTYSNRFHLEIAPIKQVPTGLEPTSDSSLKGRAQKRLIDGKLYILRDGKVYDARGNKVE